MAFLAAIWSGMGGFMKAIPREVWIGLACVLAIGLGVRWHGNQVEDAVTAADAAGYARAMGEVEDASLKLKEKATALKTKIETKQAEITLEAATNYEQALADIERRAGALRLRLEREAAHRASTGQADLSRVPGAAGEPDGSAGDNDLHTAVPVSTLIEAERNTAKLVALQAWIREQQALHQREMADADSDAE